MNRLLPPMHLLLLGTLMAMHCFLLQCVAASPTEQSLITAWEHAQKNSPKTKRFAQIEDAHYQFATTYFPFDGELRLLNACIEPMPQFGEGFQMGVLEVELVDLPAGFVQKHGYSYGMWQQSNTFFYDPRSSSWVPSSEWKAPIPPEYASALSDDTELYVWAAGMVVFVLVLLVLMGFNARKQRKAAAELQARLQQDREQAAKLNQRAMELSEERNRLLAEILATLKSQDGNSGSTRPN